MQRVKNMLFNPNFTLKCFCFVPKPNWTISITLSQQKLSPKILKLEHEHVKFKHTELWFAKVFIANMPTCQHCQQVKFKDEKKTFLS